LRVLYVTRVHTCALPISQFTHAKDLPQLLADCRRHRRCMSADCPECSRAGQRWFVAEVTGLPQDKTKALVSISIAFPKHRVPERSEERRVGKESRWTSEE